MENVIIDKNEVVKICLATLVAAGNLGELDEATHNEMTINDQRYHIVLRQLQQQAQRQAEHQSMPHSKQTSELNYQ